MSSALPRSARAVLLAILAVISSSPAGARNDVADLLDRAWQLRADGDHAAAEHFYREAAEEETRHPSARSCERATEAAGFYLGSRGYLAEAAPLLEGALSGRCCLGCGPVLVRLAEIYDDLGRVQAMEETWGHWIGSHPSPETLWLAVRVIARRQAALGRTHSTRFLREWLLLNPEPRAGN